MRFDVQLFLLVNKGQRVVSQIYEISTKVSRSGKLELNGNGGFVVVRDVMWYQVGLT